MIWLALAIATLGFVLYALFLKNEGYKVFFFLLSIFMVIVIVATAQSTKLVHVCEELSNSTCLKYKEYYEIPGSEALMYGFGMLVIAFLIITTLTLVLKAFE